MSNRDIENGINGVQSLPTVKIRKELRSYQRKKVERKN